MEKVRNDVINLLNFNIFASMKTGNPYLDYLIAPLAISIIGFLFTYIEAILGPAILNMKITDYLPTRVKSVS